MTSHVTGIVLRILAAAGVMLAGLAFGLSVGYGQGAQMGHGSIMVSDAWVRAMPPGAQATAGYFRIVNAGDMADRLVGVASDIAESARIHRTVTENGVSMMREQENGVVIPPGETILFVPASYHVMFSGLNRPLAEGEHFRSTLIFERAGEIAVDFNVLGMGAMPAHDGMPHNH